MNPPRNADEVGEEPFYGFLMLVDRSDRSSHQQFEEPDIGSAAQSRYAFEM